MSMDLTQTPPPVEHASTPNSPRPVWEPLPPLERRILGVLIEKQKTSKTADAYPLTLNSLVIGCNQKTNRDPVTDLTDDEVEEGLSSLQKKGLVGRITGGRVERFKHNLYDIWTKSGPEMAVLGELLLRGPQTKGDLRGRASRMAPIDTLDTLEELLQPLVTRQLVIYLTDPDRRGAVLTHGFHTPDELAQYRLQFGTPAAADLDRSPVRSAMPVAPREQPSALEAKLAAACAEIESLRTRVSDLEAAVEGLRRLLPATLQSP